MKKKKKKIGPAFLLLVTDAALPKLFLKLIQKEMKTLPSLKCIFTR